MTNHEITPDILVPHNAEPILESVELSKEIQDRYWHKPIPIEPEMLAYDINDSGVATYLDSLKSFEFDAEDLTDNLTISASNESKEILEWLGFDEEAIKGLILPRVPVFALSKLDHMVFRKLLDSEIEEDYLGYYVNHLPSIELDLERIVDETRKFTKTEENGMPPKGAVATYFQSVLFHELGHLVHHHLPVALLLEWEKCRDDIRVTDYVKRRFDEEGNKRYKDRFAEDFAESYAMSLVSPRLLKLRSPERYQAILDIESYVMPNAAERREARETHMQRNSPEELYGMSEEEFEKSFRHNGVAFY